MAQVPDRVPIQVINVDLAVERQKILRVRITDLFKTINNKSKKARKDLIYTVNAQNADLRQVLRTNMDADALFTSFNYDAQSSEAFKENVDAAGPGEEMDIDPQLRYPLIAAMQNLVDRGLFRHRKLILVGDIHEKIGQVLHSHIPVHITVFTNKERSQVSQPIPIKRIERILKNGNNASPDQDSFLVSQINTVQIGGIPFSGVINMPEVQNRFELKDQTIIDTTRKLYSMEGLREVMTRENQQEEKLTFVRGKKVFILLEPDLDHIIGERLIFDQMQRLYRYTTMDQAEHALATGKSQGIVEYFEREGYGDLFEVLDQEERDLFMTSILDTRLVEFLKQEIDSQKAHFGSLEDDEVQAIFYSAPEPIINEALDALKAKSYEKYLAVVPVKIRQSVIMDFLSKPKYVAAAWAGIEAKEQRDILNSQAPLILAELNLVNHALFKAKFPKVKFEFDRNFDSASVKTMSKEERESTFNLFRKSLAKAKLPENLINNQLKPEMAAKVLAAYIRNQSVEFYNRCNPLVRKQLWVTVGKEYKEHIDDTLHILDKVEILKGNKGTALSSLLTNPAFMEFLKIPDNAEQAETIFLALKRTNKIESRTALLKKLLEGKEWKPSRVQNVPKILSDPEHISIYQKLADHAEGLEFSFDSLICTKEDYEKLKDREPLKDATVTLVDEVVDSRLHDAFSKEYVSKDEYTEFSSKIDGEIDALRKKLEEQETEDPVGVYILESMQMLNEMANQAMSGEIKKEKLEEMDARRGLRQRLTDGMKAHLDKVEGFLAKADDHVANVEKKGARAKQMVDKQSEVSEQAYQKAKGLIDELQKLNQMQVRAKADKKTVALAQKDLSFQFFDIIQPLLLERIKGFPNPLAALFGLFSKGGDEVMARRVIFKFTDKEITKIMRKRIVFCTKDEILMQFIVTCLRIDNLENSLFSMSNDPTTLPKDLDIVFYGPGFEVEDFEGHVKERRMVPFADDDFYQRLLANEKLKAKTKAMLVKTDKEMKGTKAQVDQAGARVKAEQGKLRKIETTANKLAEDRTKLVDRIVLQKERRLHYQGELEILETRFEEVDSSFDGVKEQVAGMLEGAEGDTVSLVQDGTNKMGEALRDDLVKMNQELARMMYIKGVKDAGDRISKSTQDGIVAKIDARERYDFKAMPFKKVIVADDGSVHARNLKRVFISVASKYFKVSEMSMEDISIKLLDGRAENSSSADYPFVMLATDKQEDHYGELRQLVRKIRNRMPETYQLVFSPIGEIWNLDKDSEELRNINSIKDNSALINSALADYTNDTTLKNLLREKAPLA